MARHSLTGRPDEPPLIHSAPAIGLAWLVRLRWAFGLAEILIVASAPWFGTAVDGVAAGAAIATTIATNVFLLSWSRKGREVSRLLLAAILVVDGLLLTVTLRASGGAMNPFSVLYLVHVALAALLLDGRATWIVAGATCLGFGALFLGATPAAGDPHHHHHAGHAGLEQHLRGMLVAYAFAAAFVGYFVYRVARAIERRERELVALRDWAARTEKLASLSTLAAGAAHELGTPLSTIAVVAKELERLAGGPSQDLDRASLAGDARLVREEAERCRTIIAKLASDAGAAQGAPPKRAPVEDVLERVRASFDKRRTATLEVDAPPAGSFVDVPDDALVQVLVNLVSNAFDASPPSSATVTLRAGVEGDHVAFLVEDRGRGMPEEVLARLGEPFFSLKGNGGMGLGVFLARSFAERVGGALRVESDVGVGSTFTLEVPGGIG